MPISSPAHKKIKVSPPMSQGPVQQDVTEEDGEWFKVEKGKAKKIKKKMAKMEASPPRFMYSKGEIVKRREAVGINDIRDLVLHLVADAPPPSWVQVENPSCVPKVVALLIPGITRETLSLPPRPTDATVNPNVPVSIPAPSPSTSQTGVPFISSTYSHACPTRAPGDATKMHSVMAEFFHGPVTGEEKKRRQQQRVQCTTERAFEKSPARYLLTLEQMVENDYPIASYMSSAYVKAEGWVETPEPGISSSLQATSPVYAIDCEMCLTEDGKELARVCIIEYATGKVIYDRLAKPQKPILDYLTRWSGITADVLADVTTTFTEVQSEILSLLSTTPTPILLGHSLESDLKTLKMSHPYCIDTAVLFHHPRGRPFKPALAWLTKKWCGRVIQARGEGGHDPEEDARACLDLLKKKIDNGPGYGEFKTDFESIFERMARSSGRAGAGGGPIRSAVVDHGNPASMHGAKATSTVACKTDEEIFEGVQRVIPDHQFVFGRFNALADALGWITNRPSESSAPTDSEPDIPAILERLNHHLTTLHASLPPCTALIIFTGHSDPRAMSTLNAKKTAFETALREGKTMTDLDKAVWWTNQDARDLEEEVEKAKRGLLFLGIK
ncbi:ribonuclease H-like protein [Heliocybe sulcata]|uniref:Ribonuclease H-like protein n=1 Tax=Heliocybe sulcata TaxID=5364 RepID=A0A5C3MYT6_9AGAM|nr:ribonuclease H-like protein [Heliocybe sulcata]